MPSVLLATSSLRTKWIKHLNIYSTIVNGELCESQYTIPNGLSYYTYLYTPHNQQHYIYIYALQKQNNEIGQMKRKKEITTENIFCFVLLHIVFHRCCRLGYVCVCVRCSVPTQCAVLKLNCSCASAAVEHPMNKHEYIWIHLKTEEIIKKHKHKQMRPNIIPFVDIFNNDGTSTYNSRGRCLHCMQQKQSSMDIFFIRPINSRDWAAEFLFQRSTTMLIMTLR